MTKRLYHVDSYLGEFEATVLAVPENGTLVFDRSAFYPQGGGQPNDFGIVEYSTGKARILGGKDRGAEIHYAFDGAMPSPGQKIRGFVDWPRRYKLMRMHTSAHVLAAVLYQKHGALITGNQLDTDKSRMDFNLAEFAKDQLAILETEVNAELAKNHSIETSLMPREKALALPELFKLKDVLPKEIDPLRIVKIGALDIQADGGTHVKQTREVGTIKLVDFSNKGATNRRIYWQLA